MTEILSLTLPIFLLIALGFVAVRAGGLDEAFIKGLGGFVLNFAMPALILHALTSQDLRQTFSGGYVLVYALASLVVFALAFSAARLALHSGLSRSAMVALGASSSNSGFIGFPVASLALGKAALVAFPMCLVVENVIIIPLALSLAEFGAQEGAARSAALRRTFLGLLRMPLVLAIVLGALMSLAGLHFPPFLSTSIGMVAQAAVACALVVVGGTLAAQKRLAVDPAVAPVLVGKLILHPLLVAGGFLLVGSVPRELAVAGIIMASSPMLTVYPIFGQRFGQGAMCATALVVVTAAGFVTMTVILALAGAQTVN